MGDVKVWAHRGASGYAPENTLEAFKLAIEMGANGIELDVQLSADGELVVVHDETLQRVSDGQGYVKDYTLARLKELNFSKGFPVYGEVRIPTLGEVLELLVSTNLELNIELKTGVIFYPGIEEKVIAMVEKYGMQERVWYSSFNHYSVKKVKQLRTDAKVGLLYRNCICSPADYAMQCGAEALHPSVNCLRYPGYTEACKQSGMKVHTWTVNTAGAFGICMTGEVDALITNFPDKARLFMQKQGEGRYPYESPFTEISSRRFFLFGAGDLGRNFLKRYTGKYVPDAILDNSKQKWGSTVEDIVVQKPECLSARDCVVIASTYYAEIVAQLKALGVHNYYIYDEMSDWR